LQRSEKDLPKIKAKKVGKGGRMDNGENHAKKKMLRPQQETEARKPGEAGKF